MAIEAKNIQACLCKFLAFSGKTSYEFIRKYPRDSGIALFFLLLYIFLPFVFKLVMYSIPIMLSVFLIVRVKSRDASPQTQDGKKGENTNHIFPPVKPNGDDTIATRKYKKPVIQAQMSKRRNFKAKTEDPHVHSSREVKHVTFSLASDEIKEAKLEEDTGLRVGDKTLSLDTEVSSSSSELATGEIQHVNEQTKDSSDPKSGVEVGGDACHLEADMLDEAEDEDEEETQEDRNKAGVEWTEDDQKNLTDLGLSELERNRRLENLIAKRRARKTNVQENLLKEDIGSSGYLLPLQISKNPFEAPNCSDEAKDSQIPGSAPSVLLPGRNPFDLPYDPLEEKPNLMVGSFQNEFLAIQSKDIFCRHESFTLGPSFSVETEEEPLRNLDSYSVMDKRAFRDPFSRISRHSDKGAHVRLMEQPLHKRRDSTSREHTDSSQGEREGPENGSGTKKGFEHDLARTITKATEPKAFTDEHHTVSGSINEDDKNQSSSSSSEDDGQLINESRSEDLVILGSLDSSNISVTYSAPRSIATNGPLYDSSVSSADYLEKQMGHASTQSIASDMQVEVSEASSPRTVDYTTSPGEVECSLHSENAGKVTFGREEILGALSHLKEAEENESASGVHHLGGHAKSKDPLGSSVSLEELCKEDPTEDPNLLQSHTANREANQYVDNSPPHLVDQIDSQGTKHQPPETLSGVKDKTEHDINGQLVNNEKMKENQQCTEGTEGKPDTNHQKTPSSVEDKTERHLNGDLENNEKTENQQCTQGTESKSDTNHQTKLSRVEDKREHDTVKDLENNVKMEENQQCTEGTEGKSDTNHQKTLSSVEDKTECDTKRDLENNAKMKENQQCTEGTEVKADTNHQRALSSGKDKTEHDTNGDLEKSETMKEYQQCTEGAEGKPDTDHQKALSSVEDKTEHDINGDLKSNEKMKESQQCTEGAEGKPDKTPSSIKDKTEKMTETLSSVKDKTEHNINRDLENNEKMKENQQCEGIERKSDKTLSTVEDKTEKMTETLSSIGDKTKHDINGDLENSEKMKENQQCTEGTEGKPDRLMSQTAMAKVSELSEGAPLTSTKHLEDKSGERSKLEADVQLKTEETCNSSLATHGDVIGEVSTNPPGESTKEASGK